MSKIITYSFCESFLDRLTRHIDEEYIKKGKDLRRLAIVFGGKRPALFLKRDLARSLKRSFYAPRFFTIDELIVDIVSRQESFKTGIDLDNCFLLYQLTQRCAPYILEKRKTFAQFLPWAREILDFIEQLDLENVPNELLKNVQANAEIGYPVPDEVNRLLESVVLLRQAYHEGLKENKTYSRGFQYLRASELIDKADFDEFDQILFCNFFYFHRCEEKVIQTLYEKGKVSLLFQGDERKWPVLARMAKIFKTPLKEAENIPVPQFRLKLLEGFDNHSQVALVKTILKEINDLERTVIVLPNPENIIPLISEITSLVKDFNVSMGYPLRRSSLYTLFGLIFKAQISRKGDRYYARDYLKVLGHPFVKNLRLTENSTMTRILIHKIEEILTGLEKTPMSGSLFFALKDMLELKELYMLTQETLARLGIDSSTDELKKTLAQIHGLFFDEWERIDHFHALGKTLEKFLDVLIHKSFLQNYPLNINIAIRILDIKDEFLEASFNRETFPQEEIFKIFEAKIEKEFVAFHGQPLKGLQILGLLETRSLNFENVIMLDVNEGALPKLSIYEPLIPREVMINLNLDRVELEEEIQRYQFMRLISSARNVYLVYQKSKDKERSRFIEELIWEEQKKTSRLDVAAITRASFDVAVKPFQRIVPKTARMIEFLKKFKYSASSVNTYLKDPMEFYYNYVLGLKEREDLLDEPEARQVGTFIHELLEESFAPFLKKKPKIDLAFRNRFVKIFEQRFEETFGRSMRSDAFLLRAVLLERLKQFLDNEETSEERQVEEVLYLENRFEETINLPCGDVRFKYIVDRVDRLKDGTIMIIDYKTGAIDQMPKAIERIARMDLSRESIRDNVKSFQVPLYFHYLDKQFQDQPINAALYNLRTMELHRFMTEKMTHGRHEINEAFLRTLNFVMEEIWNIDVPFEADEEKSFSRGSRTASVR